jgi:hypothetical protein
MRDPGPATVIRAARAKSWPLVLVLGLAAGPLRAQQPQQTPCYTIDVTTSGRVGSGCVDLSIQTDGCGLLSATGTWTCICPFVPGATYIVGWNMLIGAQPAAASAPNCYGLLGLVPDWNVDLTQTGGHFGALLPPPPTLSGVTCLVQFVVNVYGMYACASPFVWHFSDAFQVAFT